MSAIDKLRSFAESREACANPLPCGALTYHDCRSALAAIEQVEAENRRLRSLVDAEAQLAAIAAARREEKETCAQIVELSNGLSTTQIAAAIRARGEGK